MSGVLSSCDTLATKSRRTASRRRDAVRSNTASTHAAVAERARREHHALAVDGDLRRLRRLARERGGERLAQRAIARQAIGGEGNAVGEPQHASPALVHAHDLSPRVDRDHAFLERLDDRVHVHVVVLQRLEAARELLGHSMDRRRQIADLAGRGERGAARQVARGERLRDVAQLDDGLGHRARERRGEQERRHERDEARDEHVALPARDDGIEARRGDRHARDAELRFHRDVELVVAGGRTRAIRAADAVAQRRDDLGAAAVILQAMREPRRETPSRR